MLNAHVAYFVVLTLQWRMAVTDLFLERFEFRFCDVFCRVGVQTTSFPFEQTAFVCMFAEQNSAKYNVVTCPNTLCEWTKSFDCICTAAANVN